MKLEANQEYLYRYLKFPNKSNEHLDNLAEIFISNKIYFPSPEKFNDPFDCKADFSFDDCTDEEILKYFKKKSSWLKNKKSPSAETDQSPEKQLNEVNKDKEWWIQQMHRKNKEILQQDIDKKGVLCMSTKKDDILMWSHYTDGHRGLCLEFDKKIMELWHYGSYCKNIDYRDTYLTFKEFNDAFPDKNEELIKLLLLRKFTQWEYEGEWRIIVNPDDNPDKTGDSRKFEYPEKMLAGVILGCEMEVRPKETIIDWLKKRRYKPKLYQAKKKDNAFGLNIIELPY